MHSAAPLSLSLSHFLTSHTSSGREPNLRQGGTSSTNQPTDFALQLPRQLGGSMPNCASSAGSSRHNSRGSIYSNSYVGGTGSGPSSRRSSGSRPGSRRESLFNNPSDMGLVMEDVSTSSPGPGAPSSGTSQSNFLQTLGSGVVGAASSIYQSSITPPRYRKNFPNRHHNLPFN